MSNLSTGKLICKVCSEKKVRVKIGKRKTGSIFVDQVAREWNGKVCPDCNKNRVKTSMQKLRSKEASENNN